MADAALWVATLHEVKRQAQHLAERAKVLKSDDDGVWYDVSEGIDRAALEDTPVGEEAAWRQQQWHNAFDVLFFQAPAQVSSGGQDDLLFFEYLPAHQASDNPLFVRRKGRALPADLVLGGAKADQVNWCRSTLLNLVLQTTFALTVAACPRDSMRLPALAGEEPAPLDMTRVSKPVFASPTRVTVNLDSSRSSEEQPTSTYPDLCFAVDNFDDAFKSLVLSEPGHCYVVLLVASEGLPLNPWFQRQCQDRFSSSQQAVSQGLAHHGSGEQTPLRSAAQPLDDRAADSHLEGDTSAGAAHPDVYAMRQQAASQQRGGRMVPEDAQHAQRDAFQEPPIVDLPREAVPATWGLSDRANPSAAASDLSRPDRSNAADTVPSLADSSGHQHSRLSSQAETPATAGDSLTNQHNGGLASTSDVRADPRVGPTSSLPNGTPPPALALRQDPANSAEPSAEAGAAEQQSRDSLADGARLVLFSGFVSYEQLENALVERRPGRRRGAPSGANRVRMKGPGGQGHADVAVTCLSPDDSGHLTPDMLQPAAATSRPSRQASQQGGLLGRTLQIAGRAVATTAKGVAAVLADRGTNEGSDEYHMRCALMSLSLPIDLLAAQILKLT